MPLIKLHKSDLMPSDGEITAMDAFISVMKPLLAKFYIKHYSQTQSHVRKMLW